MEKKKKIIKRIFLFLWIVILPIGMVRKSFQNDTFYSIKIGEWIINHGIDMLDHFSFHLNLAYSYPHWLYDFFIYLIYKAGGYTGIYISTIVLFIILSFTIYKTNSKITNNNLAAFLGVLMSAFVIGLFATARAQLVSYIIFVLEILFIESYLKNKKKRYLVGLFILSLLLCNMHVATWPFYFIVYLPYLAEFFIGFLLSKKKKDTKFTLFLNKKFDIERNKNIKGLIIVMILSIVTGLLTPIGTTPYTYLIKTMMGNSQKYITEHKMITLDYSPFVIVMTVLTIFLALFNKSKLRDFLMISGLVFMSIVSIRHMALLGVIGTICFVRTFDLFLTDFNPHADISFNKFASSKIGLLISFIIVAGFTSFFINERLKTDYVPEETYPVKAVEFIKNNIDMSNMKLYNGYNYGSYLLFNDIPVYIDSRADLYTKPFSGLDYDIFEDSCLINENTYRKYMDFYNITHVIIRQDEYLYNYIKEDSQFKELYKDKYFVVYKRIITAKINK